VRQLIAGLQTASDHWAYGIGFGATRSYFKHKYGVGWTLPHNIVVYLIGELGVVGFGLYMGFLGSGMLRAWRVYRHSMREGDERQACVAVALLASNIAMLFYAMFQPLIYDTFFYILTGVSSCMFTMVLGEPRAGDQADSTPGAQPRRGPSTGEHLPSRVG
jgi:O-antigen ligase